MITHNPLHRTQASPPVEDAGRYRVSDAPRAAAEAAALGIYAENPSPPPPTPFAHRCGFGGDSLNGEGFKGRSCRAVHPQGHGGSAVAARLQNVEVYALAGAEP